MESRNEQRQGELNREPRPSRRLLVPLFDRLTAPIDPRAEDAKSYRSLDFSGALASVRREVERILNTRTVLQKSGGPLTALEYGLPDFAHVSATDMQGRADLALLITRVIEAFEPRLSQVRVNLEPHPSGQRFLVGRITANLRINVNAEPVSFPLELDVPLLPTEAIQPALATSEA
ncbi:MAG: type VI secretion system baseplate subunit TssE [Bryobacteraceae bacterium]